MSSSSKSSSAKPGATPATAVGYIEDPETPLLFDWEGAKLSTSCCGVSFFLQCILIACMGSFLFGINLSLLNTSMNHIAWEFKWCNFMTDPNEEITGCPTYTNYGAFISTSVFIGAAIGSLTGGGFMSFGRRGMLLLSCAVFVIAIISETCANSFSALLWGRLVCGYAVGLCSVCVPIYMSEVTPREVRGFYGVFHQLFITIGIVIGTLLGLPIALSSPVPVMEDLKNPGVDFLEEIDTFSKVWWRVMLGFGLIPVSLMGYLLAFKFRFETPNYYLEKGSPRDAEQLLKRLKNQDDVSADLKEIQEQLDSAKVAAGEGMSLGKAWKSNKEYRWVIFLGCLLSAFQQLGGINVFIASSNSLFIDAGLSGYWPTIMSNIMNLVNCLMTLPAVPLIEKLGRRTLMVIGTIGMTIGVAPAAICYWALDADSDATKYLAIVGCMVFIVFFACTYGPVLWVYLFEIYPNEIRGAAAGTATAINWIAGIIMVFVTAYLENKYSYTIFMVMCGISAVIVFMWMKETKGRQLGDSPYITK